MAISSIKSRSSSSEYWSRFTLHQFFHRVPQPWLKSRVQSKIPPASCKACCVPSAQTWKCAAQERSFLKCTVRMFSPWNSSSLFTSFAPSSTSVLKYGTASSWKQPICWPVSDSKSTNAKIRSVFRGETCGKNTASLHAARAAFAYQAAVVVTPSYRCSRTKSHRESRSGLSSCLGNPICGIYTTLCVVCRYVRRRRGSMVASRFAFHSSNSWLGFKSPFDRLPGIHLWKSQQSHVSAADTLGISS
ncbi:hypothetical protein K456DRAFT_557765 [Colletotrichum gloeosporioides 23]|nr:hypothetical protein K456DRAFT_557765 [Colletotrichum gloeosporioides 23]